MAVPVFGSLLITSTARICGEGMGTGEMVNEAHRNGMVTREITSGAQIGGGGWAHICKRSTALCDCNAITI